MSRLAHLSPEEIAGAFLLVLVLALALIRPAPITRLFDSPYATPAPGGGPARQIVPAATASPASGIPADRRIGFGLPIIVNR
jgi:hypothetical protein